MENRRTARDPGSPLTPQSWAEALFVLAYSTLVPAMHGLSGLVVSMMFISKIKSGIAAGLLAAMLVPLFTAALSIIDMRHQERLARQAHELGPYPGPYDRMAFSALIIIILARL